MVWIWVKNVSSANFLVKKSERTIINVKETNKIA